MSTLFAVDPSVRSAGCAAFLDGRLIAAWRIVREIELGEAPGQRWYGIARVIVASVHQRLPFVTSLDELVFELPQIYTAVKSKGDPNDLIGLAGVSGTVAGIMAPRKITSPTPAQWAGQVKKATKGSAKDSPRALRILSRLDAAESALVPNQHDAIDAIGLGLFALGRLAQRRVY